MAAAVRRLKKPAVAVEMQASRNMPHVGADPVAIGCLAAKHLMERGFRRFAYCAFHGSLVAMVRGKAFVRSLKSSGYTCEWFKLRSCRTAAEWRPDHAQLMTWVKKLPKPIAVFAVGDAAAREVAMACRDQKISIPGELAILGVDNDDLLCRLCSPQLSSIDTGSQTVGFEAARLLKRMLNGQKFLNYCVDIPPAGVVVRESSDVIAVEDPLVAEAVRYIADHLSEGVSVKQMVQHLPVSRRTLEMAFRSHLRRTVHEEIVLARLNRATRLLVDGQTSLAQIASQCGVGHRSRLNGLLKNNTGMTPIEYRRRHQPRHIF